MLATGAPRGCSVMVVMVLWWRLHPPTAVRDSWSRSDEEHRGSAVSTALAQVDREKIYQWINELSSPETRENALLELSKKRESVTDLAPMLWHSCGTIAALLQVRYGERSQHSAPPKPPAGRGMSGVGMSRLGRCRSSSVRRTPEGSSTRLVQRVDHGLD
ncbi:hypothetical protein NFI96_004739 [Prochilodus magdalenae]|nr:hypothetical protein NFI96_004739 [Prochilodus magdalenae]